MVLVDLSCGRVGDRTKGEWMQAGVEFGDTPNGAGVADTPNRERVGDIPNRGRIMGV